MRAACVAPVAAALGTLTAAPAAAALGGRYHRGTWEPLRGRVFVLEQDGVRARAVLAAVEDLTGAPRGAAQRFELMFRAEHDLPDGLVTIRRRRFRARLFVVSVDRGVVAQHRQAIINRI